MDVPYSSVVCKHPASEHGTIAGEEQWTAAKITKVAAHTAINSRLECLVDMRPTTLRSNVALLRVCRIEELNAESKGVKGPVAAWSRVLGYPETFRFMKNYLGSMINIEGRGDVLVTRISRSQRLPGKGTIINQKHGFGGGL